MTTPAPRLALLLAPPATALALPKLLLGRSLEQDVLAGLLLVTTAIAATALAANASQLRTASDAAVGLAGTLGGALAFHVTLVLFGAPLTQLVERTLMLALMLATLTTLPLALRFGARFEEWVRVLLHLDVRDADEVFVAGCSIGAVFGAYLGALPIPLDWDRPWQQWPLTCVYGTLLGHAVGGAAGLLVGGHARRFRNEKLE